MNLFELFVKIGVKDEASHNLASIGQKLGSGLKTAAKVGTAAVAAAGAAIIKLTKDSLNAYAEYEQLAGGAAKIFDEMSQTKILQDAQNAYKDLGLSANQYLAVINDVGAAFASTMGDEAGYEAAKTGLKAISDYASGTGKNVDELSQKFTLITRSTSSYQSIADQFSGVLPATSAGFLEQAQAAGILSDSYTKLTEVPIDEYQAAVSKMLEKGVADLGLANNTAMESATTITGSLAATKAAWSNLIAGFGDENANLDTLIDNFVDSFGNAADNIIPKVEKIFSGITTLIQKLAPKLAKEFPKLVTKLLPSLISAGTKMLSGIMDGLMEAVPELLGMIPQIVSMLTDTLVGAWSNMEAIVNTGVDIITSLVSGLSSALPDLIPAAFEAITTLVTSLLSEENLDKIIGAAGDIISNLLSGLLKEAENLIDDAPQIIASIVKGLGDALTDIFDMGVKIVKKLWEGIKSMFTWLSDKVGGFLASIFGGGQITSLEELEELQQGSTFASTVLTGLEEEKALMQAIQKTGSITGALTGRTKTTNPLAGKGPINLTQNIYTNPMSAAELMQEAVYNLERGAMLGV